MPKKESNGEFINQSVRICDISQATEKISMTLRNGLQQKKYFLLSPHWWLSSGSHRSYVGAVTPPALDRQDLQQKKLPVRNRAAVSHQRIPQLQTHNYKALRSGNRDM